MDTNTKAINEIEYVSSFKRTTAVSIDMIIVVFFRIVVAQALGVVWINSVIQKFATDFREYFGTETIKNTPEHIQFIIQHEAFKQVLFFYFIILMIGVIYHSYLNSSAWQGTIGKRLLNIKIVTEDYNRISFSKGISHYFLSILPIIFMLYLCGFMINNNVTLVQAITHSQATVFMGFIAIIWIQVHSFTKRKTTVYDLICKTVFIRGRTSAKLPWSKI